MRKFFSFLMVALFSVSMFAEDPVTVKSTFTYATVPANNKVTDLEDVVEWDIATSNPVGSPEVSTGKYSGVEALLFGSSGSKYFGTVTLSTNHFKDYNVTSVKIYVRNNGSKKGTLTATQGSVTIGTATHSANTSAWSDLTVNTNKGEGGLLSVSYSVAQASYLSYIEVTYEAASTPEPATKHFYLKLSSDWASWPAKYAMYYFKSAATSDNGWSEFMDEVTGEENVYEGTIPEGYDKMIFVRLDGAATATSWDSKWSQTVNLDVPADTKDLFTVTSGGTGSECNGVWSVYGEAPEPVDSATLYFINVPEWETVSAYVYTNEDPYPNYKAWPGEAMKKTADQVHGMDVYSYTFPSAFNTIIFNDGDAAQTINLEWAKATPYFYFGDWYATLDEIPAPEAPATFYVTGDSALVVDAGLTADKKWNADAIKAEKDTLVLNLKAGQKYFLKVIEDGDWMGGKVFGYSNLTEITSAGLSADADDNIVFSMANDGEVWIIYFWEGEVLTFKVQSDDFYFKPVVKAEIKLVPNQWAEGDAKIAAWVWDKEGEMENYFTDFFEPIAEGNDTLAAQINVEADSIIFVRFAPAQDEPAWMGPNQWNQTPNDGIDWTGGVFTILPGTEYYTNGTWDVYVPEIPAKFYVTGDSALVVDAAGLTKDEAWTPNAIKAEKDTLVLNLKADQYYILKVAVNGTWEGANNVKGFNELTEVAEGLDDVSDDHNIGFKLNADGEVKVIYKAAVGETPELFKLEGDFYVAPVVIPAKFYVTGDSALVVDAINDLDKAWSATAIKSEKDTLVLNLKGGQEYFLKVIEDGDWMGGKVYGFDELTEYPTPGMIYADDDRNIGFKLANDGEVQIIYFWEGDVLTFKIVADFYLKPVVKAEIKLVPYQWAEGDAKIAAWVWDKEGEMESYFTDFFEPIAEGNDTLAAQINVEADSIIFVRFAPAQDEPAWLGPNQWNQTPNEGIDWTGGIFTILPGTEYFTDGTWEVYTPVIIPAGFYLVGKLNDWTPAAEYKFVENTAAENEYLLETTLAVDDAFKVVKVENNAITTWYPAGDNYVVDAAHAGEKTIYFSETYKEAWAEFGGYFYIEANSGSAIDNTEAEAKAVKVLRNGLLLIEKNGVRYYVLGQPIR